MKSFKCSGNSYGSVACVWIAENILAKCKYIQQVDLSDMFTSRLRTQIPDSVKLMMDALVDKKYLADVTLAHNAFGPDGIRSF